MPDRQKHIPSIPKIDPGEWEDFPSFRETFLHYIDDEEVRNGLRAFGKFLYHLLLEARQEPTAEGESSSTRVELESALADLKHLQGFLETTGRGYEVSSLHMDDIRLSQFAGRQAHELATIARRIEEELAS